MHFSSVHRKLTLILLSILLALGISSPINNVNAGRRHVRYYRRSRIYRRRYRHRHVRRRHYHIHYHRFHIRHHYTTPYPTVNDRIRWVNSRINWSKRVRPHKEIIKSKYGPKVTFKTLYFIPTKVADPNFFVQSINVTPDGHYAYIGYGHNPSLKHGRDLTKIVKINLRNHHLKVSKAFDGGHGQALAYNAANHSLWLLEDPGGPIHQGSLERINTGSLKPQHRIHFRLKSSDDLGDSLTFDNRNHIYNEDLIWKDTATGSLRGGMIILYRGLLSSKHVKFNIVLQGLRHSPGNVIQGIAYNPRTKRLYIEANDAIISIPANKLGHLRPNDVREMILRQRREYEGIAFDRAGHAYILLNHPKEIMKSTKVF